MSTPLGRTDFGAAIDELRILASTPGEDAELIAACDRLHHLIDRQGEALRIGGTASARRWRTLRMQADDLEALIAGMTVRTTMGRRAMAEVALRLVPQVPRLMVLARAALLDLSRLGLEHDAPDADAQLLALLREVSIHKSVDSADQAWAMLAEAAAQPAFTQRGRQAKARALLDSLQSPEKFEGLQAELARSLAQDVLGEPTR